MTRNKEPDHTALNLVGSATIIKGEVTSKGDIRIDGKIIGKIHSEGKVVIGSTGSVEGDIICANADFSGKVKGKADVNELLTLKASAEFTGDIITDKLAIEPGAFFSGSCSMDKETEEKKVSGNKKR